jgi:uncharacterized protein YjiS (DUF1127 family)
MQFVQAHLVALLQNYKALLRRIVEWRQCAAGRRELRTLTDRDLHDIGIGAARRKRKPTSHSGKCHRPSNMKRSPANRTARSLRSASRVKSCRVSSGWVRVCGP